MNTTDRAMYLALKHIADRDKSKLTQKQRDAVFDRYLAGTLLDVGYCSKFGTVFILTEKGLEHLHKLEAIHRSEMTLNMSTLAIAIFTVTKYPEDLTAHMARTKQQNCPVCGGEHSVRDLFLMRLAKRNCRGDYHAWK